MRRLRLVGPSSPVGYYLLGETARMYLSKKPSLIHRTFCRLLLGWKWRDSRGFAP